MRKNKNILQFTIIAGLGLTALYGLSSNSYSAKKKSNSSLTCSSIPQLLGTYLVHHVKERKITSEIKEHTIATYIKRLDPSKTRLLKSEVKMIKRKLQSIFKDVESGKCQSLVKIQADLEKKSKEIENYVRSVLSKSSYKLDETVELTIDPDKRGFPKSISQRNKLLLKLIHFQISNYLSAGTKLKEARNQLIHRYELITKRIKEKTVDDLYAAFIDAFAVALDPHSSYYTPDVLEDFQIQMGLSLEGIGVSLTSRDGYTVVEEIIPGGAAHRISSLKPKDKIIAVKQAVGSPINIIDMSLRDVVRLIRGKKGSKVSLTILRQGDKTERFTTTIIRDKIDLKEQAANIKYHDKTVDGHSMKLGVIDLPSFYGDRDPTKRSSYRDMKRLLVEATAKNVDGIVLDLSRNGGGLLTDAVKISGLFIRQGGIVATRDSQSSIDVLKDLDSDVSYSGPVVVLTSRLSASASEILAGALKDYNRALIVGDDHTFGKGTVQSVLPLPPGYGAIKVTSGMFFRPQGQSTQNLGVGADIVIPSGFNTEEIGEKTLDYAIKAQKISPFSRRFSKSTLGDGKIWKSIDRSLIGKLAAKSKRRIDASKEFTKLKERMKKAKENNGIVKLADVRKEAKKVEGEKKKNGKDKDTAVSRKEESAKEREPQLMEAMNVLGDYLVSTGALKANRISASQNPKSGSSN